MKSITTNIFCAFFRAELARTGGSRMRVAWAIARRVRESRTDDAWIAFGYAFEANHPQRRCTRRDLDQWQSALRVIFRRAFPFSQPAGMLVAPLALPISLRHLACSAAAMALRRALLSQCYRLALQLAAIRVFKGLHDGDGLPKPQMPGMQMNLLSTKNVVTRIW